MFVPPSQAARPQPNSGITVSSRFPSSRPHLPAQRPDRLDQPAPDIIEKPDVGRELDLLRKHRRIGQHSSGLDDSPLDQNRIGLFLQRPEKYLRYSYSSSSQGMSSRMRSQRFRSPRLPPKGKSSGKRTCVLRSLGLYMARISV